MSDVTRILSAIEQGEAGAAEQLLPLVYEELRKLAAQKMAQEKPGQTLDATGLVHEAYVRLVVGNQSKAGTNDVRLVGNRVLTCVSSQLGTSPVWLGLGNGWLTCMRRWSTAGVGG